MNATAGDKVRRGYSPYLDGFGHAAYNSLDAMAAAIDDETAAIIVEPIQGEGGVHVPDDDYLPGLRALCDEHDLLLISDEVWTGCGRTGNWFAYQHTEIKPDIMTLGKAIGCGLPVSVMCADQRIADLFSVDSYGGVPHASTLAGNCIPMAVSTRMFEIIERDGLVERAKSLGDHLIARCATCPTPCRSRTSVVAVSSSGWSWTRAIRPPPWTSSAPRSTRVCCSDRLATESSASRRL